MNSDETDSASKIDTNTAYNENVLLKSESNQGAPRALPNNIDRLSVCARE